MENGDLQKEVKAAGFTHLVTYDKSMADKHVPHMPVLAIDNPSHGEAGRTPGDISDDEIGTTRRTTNGGYESNVPSRSRDAGADRIAWI